MKAFISPSLQFRRLLVFLITIGCRSWAGEIVVLKDLMTKQACTTALIEAVPLDSAKIISVYGAAWLNKIADSKIINTAVFEEIGNVNGGTLGLLSVSTTGFSIAYYYIHLSQNDTLIDHVEVHRASGGLSDRDWKSITIEARQAVRDLAARKFAKSIEGGSGQIILKASRETDPNQARRFFAISDNGKFLAVYEKDLVEIRPLTSSGKAVTLSIDFQDRFSWLHSISDDGQRVVVSLRPLDKAKKAVIQILNISSAQVEFSAEQDVMGFPYIRFFEGGYTALSLRSATVYRNGKVANVYPIANSTLIGECGLTCINMPREGYYNLSAQELLIFSHGPQPIQFSKGKLNTFEDIRSSDSQKESEERIDDLLVSLASDKYVGLSERNFSVSRNWQYVAQERQSGSGLDLSLRNSAVLFDTDGRFLRAVNSFWTIGSISLSQDGKYLAISELLDGPIPTLGPHKRIWIYSTDHFDFPIYTIAGIELWTVDRMTFSENSGELYVESINSGKILKYLLAP